MNGYMLCWSLSVAENKLPEKIHQTRKRLDWFTILRGGETQPTVTWSRSSGSEMTQGTTVEVHDQRRCSPPGSREAAGKCFSPKDKLKSPPKWKYRNQAKRIFGRKGVCILIELVPCK